MPYSCSPDEIDPSIALPDIAQEILSLQTALRELWNEYADIAMISGLVDSTKEPMEIMDALESSLMAVADGGAHSALELQPSDISWQEEYGQPKSISYGFDGVITYTLDSGETFNEKD